MHGGTRIPWDSLDARASHATESTEGLKIELNIRGLFLYARIVISNYNPVSISQAALGPWWLVLNIQTRACEDGVLQVQIIA